MVASVPRCSLRNCTTASTRSSNLRFPHGRTASAADARAKFGPGARIRVWSAAGETFRHDGQIHALVTVPSDRCHELLSLIQADAATFAHHGVTAAQFASGKADALRDVAKEKDTDEWWVNTVLPYAGSQPFRIYWAGHIDQEYGDVTAAEVNALAKRYLVNAKAYAVVGVCQR